MIYQTCVRTGNAALQTVPLHVFLRNHDRKLKVSALLALKHTLMLMWLQT